MVREAGINPMGLDWRRFVVAETVAGDSLGYGQIKRHRDGTRELASLVVREDWRGKGVARAIVQQLMRQAGPPLWLMCRSGLVPFYRRFGFVEVRRDSRLPPYFRNMRRLVGAFQVFAHSEEYLAIMVWETDAPGEPGVPGP